MEHRRGDQGRGGGSGWERGRRPMTYMQQEGQDCKICGVKALCGGRAGQGRAGAAQQ